MDNRIGDQVSDTYEMVRRMMLQVHTCIPGIIRTFDPASQTCSVSPAIKMRIKRPDGTFAFEELPIIVNAPLVFPNAGGFYITLPVQAGDNCLLLFSERALDNWHDLGGVQPPENEAVVSRNHDLTDALVLLAPVPLSESVANYSTVGVSVRNEDNSMRMTVEATKVGLYGGSNSIVVDSTGITFTGNVAVSGSGTLKRGSGPDLFAHRHTDPQGGYVGSPVT